jgi:hypothetical protein
MLRQLGVTNDSKAFTQWLHPHLFGAQWLRQLLRIVAAITPAEPDGFPAGRLVTSSLVRFRIGKGLGKERVIAETLLPLARQLTDHDRQGLRGQIGFSFGVEHEEAALVDEQLQALGARHRIPADALVP